VETGILIVHPGALGDVLQAVPALRGLRAAVPGATLVFAGQPRIGRLLVALDVVSEARGFDSLGLEMLFTDEPLPESLIRFAARFERIVSWFASHDPRYRARLATLARDVVVASPLPDDETPVWRHLAATLQPWAVAVLDTPAALRVAAAPATRGPLVVHPGAGGAWKQWPVERFAEVIAAVTAHRTLPVVVHQGPADAAAAGALLSRIGRVAERLVEPELTALAHVLAGARAYLGGDSGVSHLAAAVGAPSVILFPPATRRRWAPWSPTAVSLTMTGEPGEATAVARELERLLAPPARH